MQRNTNSLLESQFSVIEGEASAVFKQFVQMKCTIKQQIAVTLQEAMLCML